MAHYNNVNVGELISDEPLDLSMKKSRHEMEYVRGPLVVQPNTLQPPKVVVARMWQTNVVIRSLIESPQQVQHSEVAKEKPIPNKAQPRKRFRFNHYQIGIMERVFEIKKFPSSAEIIETANLLGATEHQVRNWFSRRCSKWKREFMRSAKLVRIAPAPAQESSPSSSSTF
ncbi:hypothetical protein DAPPUDRAFT_315002 [Daphnia pulex]|uniref:Homeobox domain-containing protein n=1 Tax=Daphnia pulex TaxID=6669 RepID=E9G8E0_DAPPU|nr:hypothetical protein DAPPUDRAFT_315002 [Daphnia pulex]|eukprot:EFX84288.1 hypothetical protein DAPPUDRAFT_315002 [Daphnia pulex]